ncbi:MAG: hypothetical protein IPJ65_17515 [Archangiaceae bacterium]|nr:hypothetical protein [Archangiaceae bacterium]
MNLRSVTAALALFLAMPLTGCIIVDKTPSTTGTAALVWTFPPNSAASNPTCAQAGVTKVFVSIDNGSWVEYACADGQTTAGVSSPLLSVGTHSIALSATNSMGYEYYAKSSSLPISATSSLQQYDLDWAVGGATVHWVVTDASGSVTQTCGQSGIDTVYVNFRDSAGNLVYEGAGDPEPCSAGAIVYSFIKPGTYDVFLGANGAGSSSYESSRLSPPRVTIQAGVFPSMSEGPTLLLRRVQ